MPSAFSRVVSVAPRPRAPSIAQAASGEDRANARSSGCRPRRAASRRELRPPARGDQWPAGPGQPGTGVRLAPADLARPDTRVAVAGRARHTGTGRRPSGSRRSPGEPPAGR
jgi:hypothetical protein